ncbi:uncharacterized protein LOC119560131 [Drosophila subpulchrella]|uniref:uncharacterized protein LOC119560131 n=1 Tax=Drosophila subpulchrella TaxID=1486046 RepID=UPI0018A18F7D|nr:uncharacterized protein LOC119560131 [Drosophila subpulchrella]
MENSWSSFASMGSLVVPHTSAGLPGFPGIDHGDEDGSPLPKITRMAEHVQDYSLTREMDNDFKEEAARFQSLQPVTVVIQPPKRSPPEAENNRRMYIPDLNQVITHRDIFNYFCIFGDLERVCVKNGSDNLNYAMVLFSRTASMEQAIKSSPHLIKGNRLSCRKATVRSGNRSNMQTFGIVGNQRIESSKKGPKSLVEQLPKTPEWLPKKDKSNKFDPQKQKKPQKHSIRRSARLQKLVEAKSKKTVAPVKADKNYVYAVTTKDGVSRWSFKLSESSLSLDEVRVFKKGTPRAAQTLRNLREKVMSKSSEHAKQDPELLESETKPNALKILETNPDHVKTPAPIPIDLPLAQPLTRTPWVPLPKLVIPEFSKPDLRSKILSTLGQNYVHHCYTNVEAYRKSKCYIDLPPDELIKRPSVKEYVDQMYAEK